MDSNRDKVEHVLALMGKGDWDGLADLFHDDVVVEWPQSGERLRGKANCLKVFQDYPGGAPTMRPSEILADGDLVVARADIDYPDGSTWKSVSIFQFRDGKVAKEIDYFGQPFEAPEWRADFVELT